MDQGSVKAAGGGRSPDDDRWEGRELEAGTNIWANISNPPTPSSSTRSRSDSAESYVDLSSIDHAAQLTESNDEFEILNRSNSGKADSSAYANRLQSIFLRRTGPRGDGAEDLFSEDGEEGSVSIDTGTTARLPSEMDNAGSSNDYNDSDWQQAGHNADAQDLAGPGAYGFLQCAVSKPQKEAEGTQNAYISYLVTTDVCPSQPTP